MNWWTARSKVFLVAFVLLASAVPAILLDTGDAAECEPTCDFCHYAHDRVYWAFLDITKFDVPLTLDGAEKKSVEVQLRLHGNVGLGYTTISRGWLELTSNGDMVAVEKPRQDFISFEPGFRSFSWNVSGRLAGTDNLHVQVYAIGVHLAVEFREMADSGSITVTNPVNAAPRIGFSQPDGYADTADTAFVVGFVTEDPNSDPLKVDLYYDTDPDRDNGQTRIVTGLSDPDTYVWNTRSVPDGWYWLHADVDDQRGGEDEGTSKYPVIVSHGNQVPKVELLYPPLPSGVPPMPTLIHDPVDTFTWRAEDGDGDSLTFEFWVGREPDSLELVDTTTQTQYDYAPPDNANLWWMVIPKDRKVRGWCEGGPRPFRTEIAYPVEVDLILPADGSTVPGPDVKLVWYGRDLDFEQVLYDVYLEVDGDTARIAKDWDDPAGPVLIVPDLVPGKTYTWWVEGNNPFSPKGISESWSFTVAVSGFPIAVLGFEDIAPGVVTLTWSPSPEGTAPAMYTVHLVDEFDGDQVVLENTTLTSLTLDDLIEDNLYHWYVLPVDSEGNEGYSEPVFSTFTFDTNTPPIANISDPLVQVPPGDITLQWTGHDPDGDQILYDVYLDAVNGTTLVATDLSGNSLDVVMEADLIYRWRVQPHDLFGPGVPASGTVITESTGSVVGATGRILSPLDGAVVTGNVVNLTWEAFDPLSRTLLFDLYIDLEGGNPFIIAPTTTNITNPWWLLELGAGVDEVGWAVVVRPLGGPSSFIGLASFTVSENVVALPNARLAAGGMGPGQPLVVKAHKVVQFNATGSEAAAGGALQYWFDFGDGRESGWINGTTFTHVYLTEGMYNATLVVREVGGLESEPASVVVEVEPGKLSSDEDIPATGAGLAVLAILVTTLRRRTRGGGG
jgi:hypothetical protein